MPNPKREPYRTVDGVKYHRIAVQTHIIQPGEDIAEVVERYTKDLRQPGDIITVSESPTAIS